ncbi:MAG: hypothetical protein DHS20C16_33920 [Phycisphaerae bacterium]|nr:MAG: hypothetical protein DHS20C16_33920 [Phycisphaerae bacterium]
MIETDTNRDPFELLAAEFTDRCRRGESPSIEEYARQHPELAEKIRELFPWIANIEKAKNPESQPPGGGPVRGGLDIEQLGDFRIIRELGRGGMGIVYEAEQESLGRRVALKVLPQQLLLNSSQVRRFEREARTAARLHHTNIVPIFGVGTHDGYHYFAMQYIRGVGLDVVLRELRFVLKGNRTDDTQSGSASGPSLTAIDVMSIARSLAEKASHYAESPTLAVPSLTVTSSPRGDGESFSTVVPHSRSPIGTKSGSDATIRAPGGSSNWRSVAHNVLQAAEALDYAHGQGTLHRDVKPANLLIDGDGTVWVADFGVAKALDQKDVTQTGGVVGTLQYMAPEQFSGNADTRSDVYSLGLTLYELATLQPAFMEDTTTALIKAITHGSPKAPRQLCPDMPRDLETIILKCIARDPEARYPSAHALATDLRRFMEDRPILARRATLPERFWRWSRRNPALATMSGTAMGLLFATAVIATAAYIHSNRANVRVRSALASEQIQRSKAEATSTLAVEALDTIFDMFAPIRTSAASSLTIDGVEGTTIDVPIQPVLSRESAAALEHMLDFYRRLAAQDDADPVIRLKIAEANRRVGNIHSRLGQFDNAEAAYTQSIRLFEQIEAENGVSPTTHIELARINNQLGITFVAQDRAEDGRTFFREARKNLEDLQLRSPESPTVRFELARSCYLLAKAPRRPIAPSSGREHPRRPPPRGERGSTARNQRPPGRGHGPPMRDRRPLDSPSDGPRNRRHERRTRPDEGDDPWRTAVEILTALSAEYPDVPDYRHLLALCYRDLPPPLPWSEDGQPSRLDAMTEAIAILRQLLEDFPDVPKYRFDLSETYSMAADPELCPGPDPHKIEEQRLRDALKISKQLAAEHANIAEYIVAQVHIRLRFAGFMRRMDQLEEAREHLREARALQFALAQRFPDTPNHQVSLAAIEGMQARLMRRSGNMNEELSHIEKAVDILNQLPEDWEHPPYVRHVRAATYRALADAQRLLGNDTAAAEATRQAERYHRNGGRHK